MNIAATGINFIRQAEIAGQSQFQSAAEAIAVDRRNQDFAGVAELANDRMRQIEVFGCGAPLFQRSDLFQRRARHKDASTSRENHYGHIRVGLQMVHGAPEIPLKRTQ